MTTHILRLFFILLISQKSYGQKLVAQHYSIANGLPSNEVIAMYRDKTGFIWLATDRGLCKFDGKTFKIYTVKEGLPENSILEVKEDKEGKIWCRSFSGLFTIIKNDSVYNANINEDIKRLKLESQLYQFEFDDSLNLYLATRDNGLIYKSPFPHHKLNQIPLLVGPISFYQISTTKLIAAYRKGLTFVGPNMRTIITLKKETQIKNLFKGNLKDNYYLRYIYTSKFLVLSTNETIHTISMQTKNIASKALPFQVSSMTLLSDSTIFLGGLKGELALFNVNKNTCKIIDKFPSSISSIYYENNACWISTLRNGIYHLPNINYNVLHVNKEQLISMLPISDDSLYLLNANSDIELMRSGKSEKLSTANKQKTLMYWQRFDHSQKEYIPLVGCFDYIIERSTKNKIKFDMDSRSYSKQTEFVVPVDSLIYTSFYGGLRAFNKKSKLLSYSRSINVRVTCMFGHIGVLYIGTLSGMYKLANNQSVPLDSHALFKHRVAAIDRIGRDTLVIATQANGIGIYNIKTKELSLIKKEFGLENLTIQHVYVDDENKIWVATQQSIVVLKLNANGVYDFLDVVDLSIGDLSIKEVRVLNKQVYILAGNQVVKIAENLIKFNLAPYPIILTELLINGKNKDIKNLTFKNLLPYENNFLVKFQLLSFTQNSQVAYRYQLNDAPWVYTSNNELQLASLPSASYTLNIQGRLKNGAWSAPATIDFLISKPFYKTAWFISLVILSALILVYLAVSYLFKRKYRKRVKEFELKRELESARLMASKSQMNPHFIFNALNSIQNFIIKSEKIQAYEYLTDFSTLIRNYLEYSNKDYLKLDRELELINTYIKIEQLRIPFHFELYVAENIKSSEEYIFTLLLQPCLENAIWHGLNHKTGDKKIKMALMKSNGFIDINITDNGIGRAQSAIINANRVSKPPSVATNNMLSRIHSLRLLYKNDIKIKILDNFDANSISIGTTILISFEVINEKN